MKRLLMISCLALLWACDDTSIESEAASSEGGERYLYIETSVAADTAGGSYDLLYSESSHSVLIYSKYHPGIEGTFDTDHTEYLALEIPEGLTEFEVHSMEELEKMGLELYYTRSCECYAGPFGLELNLLKGKRLTTDRWELTFDIQIEDGNNKLQMRDTGDYRKP